MFSTPFMSRKAPRGGGGRTEKTEREREREEMKWYKIRSTRD